MKKTFLAAAAAAAVFLSSCISTKDFFSLTLGDPVVKSAEDSGRITEISTAMPKDPSEGNPIISNVFCADPTSIEYDGRLFVYGTCDQQQFDKAGEKDNTYEHIKSLVVLSTDDMVNYTYHGVIDVGAICPWIVASWAPSIVSREEDDGLTHFYLYFSNSGWGTGVITSTSPTGPWSDPLGRSLVDGSTKGLRGCKIPFDPGVCIDGDGTGWITFGGGGGDNARIAKLGSDMLSIDGEVKKIHAPHHFEANELNFINGTYVYTYNTDWEKHFLDWDIEGADAPPTCSMCYMTSKTPLDTSSWEYRDYYFKNPGEQGLEYSNNHTHLQKYKDKYYLFYHSLFPQKAMGANGGYRSICVDEADVSEDDVLISEVSGSRKGVSQIKDFDPHIRVDAATAAACSQEISYIQTDSGVIVKSGNGDGKASWICIRSADLGNGPEYFAARVRGKGRIELRTGSVDGITAASVDFDCTEFSTVYGKFSTKISGVNDIYLIISDGTEFESWEIR